MPDSFSLSEKRIRTVSLDGKRCSLSDTHFHLSSLPCNGKVGRIAGFDIKRVGSHWCAPSFGNLKSSSVSSDILLFNLPYYSFISRF